jgi:hypothetical protein
MGGGTKYYVQVIDALLKNSRDSSVRETSHKANECEYM